MQRLHVAAFWFGLAGNIFLDLFLYVHIKYKITGCLLCLFKSRPVQFYCATTELVFAPGERDVYRYCFYLDNSRSSGAQCFRHWYVVTKLCFAPLERGNFLR